MSMYIANINANYCPHCLEKTEYHANPYYHHRCEHCGKTMSMHDLISGVDIGEAVFEIMKLKERMDRIRNGIDETREKLRKAKDSMEKVRESEEG